MIAKLNKNFINSAIDINYAQHQQDNEGRFFRKIAEQGHYAGRTKPTATRQGLYITTADGNLLASTNTTSAQDVIKLIDTAMEKWNQSKQLVEKFADNNEPDKRFNVAFPAGGMILRQTSRDLPRKQAPEYETWRHNFDHAWLTAAEVKSFVPMNLAVGEKYAIPDAFVQRLARFHFVDQVKGEADAFGRSAVSQAKLEAEVVEVANGTAKIRLQGTAKCVQPPSGDTNPYSGSKVNQERGVDLSIRGWLQYDTTKQAFDQFDLVAIGDRWGTATYNFRQRDMGPAPIGFAFELLPTKSENMTKPKFLLWDYFE